jgi:hypothetical protein
MKTATAPEKAIAVRRKVRFSSGLLGQYGYRTAPRARSLTYKLRERLSRDQSSTPTEKMRRTGMERRLL